MRRRSIRKYMESKNMRKLFATVVMAVCGSFILSSPAFENEDKSNEVIQVDESYFSNSDNPIVLDFKKVKTSDQLDNVLEEYIRKNYEEYTIKGRMFTSDGDHFIIALALKNDDGKRALVYFDVTEAYKKIDQSGDKETKKKMKARKSKHLNE